MSNFRTPTIICLIIILMAFRTILHLADYRYFSQQNALNFRKREDTYEAKNPDESADRIFWFLQISDIHISKYFDSGRISDLLELCSTHIPTIAPDIVIVSGDITDAKIENRVGSTQLADEWSTYEQIILKSGVLNFTKWLDIRGNHDAFNVPSLYHAENFFRQYSVQGKSFSQSYMVTHRKSYGTYSFIAMDACPSPGIKRPYNFFGLITTDLANMLRVFSEKSESSNQTFWFGHYPTSTIISPGFDLRSLIGKTAYAYFAGHLHTLHNWVHSMYTVQPQGFFELELADWRDSRFFRIVAVDHDLVSFTDVSMLHDERETWPIVLITNPKNAAFLLPNKEPTARIRRSTHIRVLAWSLWPIRKVSISINGEYQGDAQLATTPSSSLGQGSVVPLYVLRWDPDIWISKPLSKDVFTHYIEVTCEDEMNHSRIVKQFFTLDGTTRWKFRGLQSFILLGDHSTNILVAFYFVWILPFSALVLARFRWSSRLYLWPRRFSVIFVGFYELAQYDLTFFSLFCYLLYVLCGPIFVGYLLQQYFGVVFSFGIFVNNSFIPESTTYLVEIVQQLIFTYPLLFILGRRFGKSFYSEPNSDYFSILLMSIITTVQLTFTVYDLLLPYGLAAFILSPGRLWLIPFAWFLFNVSSRRPASTTTKYSVRSDSHGDKIF